MDQSLFDVAMDVIMLYIVIYQKRMIDLSDDEGNCRRTLKEPLEARNWGKHNGL